MLSRLLTLCLLTLSVGDLRAAPPPMPACCPEARYYVILFGGQGNILRPRTAHTWATFIRVSEQPGGAVCVEPHTISWLPATLNVRPWAIRAETGVNLDLFETLDFMSGRWQRISLWGPYEISADHFQRALQHKAALERGEYRYRVVDLCVMRSSASHCVHAVTLTDPRFFRASQPVLWFGEVGTAPVAGAMMRSGVIVDPDTTHDWLLPALGLNPENFILRRPGDYFPIFRR